MTSNLSLGKLIPKAEKLSVPPQAERVNFPFLYLFVLFGPSVDWMMPLQWRGHQSLLRLRVQMPVSS